MEDTKKTELSVYSEFTQDAEQFRQNQRALYERATDEMYTELPEGYVVLGEAIGLENGNVYHGDYVMHKMLSRQFDTAFLLESTGSEETQIKKLVSEDQQDTLEAIYNFRIKNDLPYDWLFYSDYAFHIYFQDEYNCLWSYWSRGYVSEREYSNAVQLGTLQGTYMSLVLQAQIGWRDMCSATANETNIQRYLELKDQGYRPLNLEQVMGAHVEIIDHLTTQASSEVT